MNKTLANKVIIEEMQKHDLFDKGWTIAYSNRLTRALAHTGHAKKEITFSNSFIDLNTEELIRDVARHEIAHALVPARNGHNKVWRLKAVEVGCSNTDRFEYRAVLPPKKYITICPNGHTGESNRAGSSSCGRCSRTYNPEYKLKYIKRDIL